MRASDGTPPNIGHEAIRAFFTHIFSGFKAIGLTEDGVYANGSAAAVKWTAKGVSRSGKSVTFEGADVLDCDEAGKIVLIRAFWDPAPVMAALQP
jgi:steroid delta-isomerase